MSNPDSLSELADAVKKSPRVVREIPNYSALGWSSFWVGIVGFLCEVLGVISLCFAGYVFWGTWTRGEGIVVAFLAASVEVISGLSMICVGSFIRLIAKVSLAIRDIAQNSFYK